VYALKSISAYFLVNFASTFVDVCMYVCMYVCNVICMCICMYLCTELGFIASADNGAEDLDRDYTYSEVCFYADVHTLLVVVVSHIA
jgi:hypothetical protein